MTFEEWAQLLDLREKLAGEQIAKPVTKPWRCVGVCRQLMYGIEWIGGHPYPSPQNTPVGYFLSEDFPRVCDVCWNMYETVKNRSYWVSLSVKDRKRYDGLQPGGNYLAT